MPRLLHHSHTPVTKVRSISLTDQKELDGGLFKPRGLWVSVEGEYNWMSWCQDNEWSLGKHITEIMLHPDANVLWIKSMPAFDKFHTKYSTNMIAHSSYKRDVIDWTVVAQEYQGVIITPY